MNGRKIFETWTQTGTVWTRWVRPVYFIALNSFKNNSAIKKINIPQIFYMDALEKNSAVILDLPGRYTIDESFALAKLGWRPIPLYNGTDPQEGVMSLVDNKDIEDALAAGADELKKFNLPDDAPPSFLLDSNRTHMFKMNISIFDNSWDIYGQDMPSGAYLLKNGINKVIVRSQKLKKDLKLILYKFQKSGLKIYFTNGFEKPKEIAIRKPQKKLLTEF